MIRVSQEEGHIVIRVSQQEGKIVIRVSQQEGHIVIRVSQQEGAHRDQGESGVIEKWMGAIRGDTS